MLSVSCLKVVGSINFVFAHSPGIPLSLEVKGSLVSMRSMTSCCLFVSEFTNILLDL